MFIATLPIKGVYGGRLVHMGKTLNRFGAVSCTKVRLAAGPAGGAIALDPPDPLALGEGGKGKERVRSREGRKGREGKG